MLEETQTATWREMQKEKGCFASLNYSSHDNWGAKHVSEKAILDVQLSWAFKWL